MSNGDQRDPDTTVAINALDAAPRGTTAEISAGDLLQDTLDGTEEQDAIEDGTLVDGGLTADDVIAEAEAARRAAALTGPRSPVSRREAMSESMEMLDIEALVAESPAEPAERRGTDAIGSPMVSDDAPTMGAMPAIIIDDNASTLADGAMHSSEIMSTTEFKRPDTQPAEESPTVPHIKALTTAPARGETLHEIQIQEPRSAIEIDPSSFATEILALARPQDEALSQFRILKRNMEEMLDRLGYTTVAITSAHPGEGRTSTAVNLAVVMSENPWLKIALIDLNLRKPALGRIMGLDDQEPGLLQVLSGRVHLEEAMRKLANRNLYLLHAGGASDSGLDVLNSPQFDVLLGQLKTSFDLVLIDAPAVLGQDDALVIHTKVDGVIMIIRAESTRLSAVNRAVGRLGKERLLGVILNDVRPHEVQ